MVSPRVIQTLLLLELVGGAFAASAKQRAPGRGAPLVVIVNPKNPIIDISKTELQRLFTRRRHRWAFGPRVLPINWKAKTNYRIRFDRIVLSMSAEQSASYWIDNRIRSGQRPPLGVSKEALILRIVANQRGAIAYLPASAVRPSVKVLKIDGRAVSDPKYLLGRK